MTIVPLTLSPFLPGPNRIRLASSSLRLLVHPGVRPYSGKAIPGHEMARRSDELNMKSTHSRAQMRTYLIVELGRHPLQLGLLGSW